MNDIVSDGSCSNSNLEPIVKSCMGTGGRNCGVTAWDESNYFDNGGESYDVVSRRIEYGG